jgi:hypothetical protein
MKAIGWAILLGGLAVGVTVVLGLAQLQTSGVAVPAALCEGINLDHPPAWFIEYREGMCMVFP